MISKNKLLNTLLITLLLNSCYLTEPQSKSNFILNSEINNLNKEDAKINLSPNISNKLNPIYCSDKCDTTYISHNPLRICHKSFWGTIEEDTIYIKSSIYPEHKLISEGVIIKSNTAHEGFYSGNLSIQQKLTAYYIKPATIIDKSCMVKYNAYTIISYTYNGENQIGIAKGKGPIDWHPKSSKGFTQSFSESHTVIFK